MIDDKRLKQIVSECIRKTLSEMQGDFENVETFNVFNDNFDNDWMSVLNANLYDANDNCVGTLKEMHFKYNPESNGFVGDYTL